MKAFKILQIAAICFAISWFGIARVQAQRMTPDQRVQMRMEKMKKQLNLTDDQSAKIQPILMDAQQKMMQLRNSGADPQSMKQQRKAIAENTDKQITALLNPDQIQQYNTMKAQMKQRRMQNRGGGGMSDQPGE